MFGFLVAGWQTALTVIVIYGLINAIVQSVIQPRVVGNAVALSQTITFFSVLFWAIVIGPIGAIIAVALSLLAKVILIDADPDTHWWRSATSWRPGGCCAPVTLPPSNSTRRNGSRRHVRLLGDAHRSVRSSGNGAFRPLRRPFGARAPQTYPPETGIEHKTTTVRV